ncbi:MAG: hypothetical protein K5657_06470 [Desulfovibrio sp.]|nr:hypothetical protein [Desulfovibrio sp.]
MADTQTNALTETSYNTEAWHYRHAVVAGVIIFFSLFYLVGRGLKDACLSFCSSINDGWNNQVKPFVQTSTTKSTSDVQTSADISADSDNTAPKSA